MYNSHIQYIVDLSNKLKDIPLLDTEESHYHTTDIHGDIFSLCIALIKSGIAKCVGYIFIDIRTENEVEGVVNQFITTIPDFTINPNFRGYWTMGGDLIDRGKYSIECILIMNRIYKQAKRKNLNFFWLIGNHELFLYQNDFSNAYLNGFYAPNNLEKEYFNLMRNIFIDNLANDIVKTCCYIPITHRIVSHVVLTKNVIANPNMDIEELCDQLNDAIQNVDFDNPLLDDVFATRSLIRNDKRGDANYGKIIGYKKHALLPQVVGHDIFSDEEYVFIKMIQEEYPMVIYTDNKQSSFYRKGDSISCLFVGNKDGKYKRVVTRQNDIFFPFS